MPLSNYPAGFKAGITIRGVPLEIAYPGKVFWVNNSGVLSQGEIGGSDGNPGTYQKPFSTIAGALAQCTASRGDVIFVKPGHAETIANATTLLLNVASVAIIGLGTGSKRPTLTFSTSAAANIPLVAANMAIHNFLFRANVADVVSVFTATGTNTPTDLTIDYCEFRDLATNKNFITVITDNATANSMDGLWFTRNRISSLATTAATTAIKLTGASHDRVTIQDNYGNWAVLNDTAAMLATGANNVTNFDFARNILNRPNTSSTGGSFVSTSGTAWTGHAYDNYMYQLDNSAGIWIATGTKLAFSQNFSPITAVADKSGLINPVAV
jgi:hypothetical protein